MLQRRAILSVALLFMLSLVIIGPNKETYHGQLLAPVFSPIYAALEFGSTWSFFAPDPGPAPVRLEWEVIDSRGEVVRDGYFPDEGYPYFINERQTRRVAMARFFYFFDDRHTNVWASWLCRSNPDANGFRLWKAEAKIPNLFKVQLGEESISDTPFGERKSLGNVYCDRLPEAEAPAGEMLPSEVIRKNPPSPAPSNESHSSLNPDLRKANPSLREVRSRLRKTEVMESVV